jgi:hypothetical protein
MAQKLPLKITPPPGVVLTETERSVEGRWIASQGIRFYRGKPQKIGGWRQAFDDLTDGVPRALHAWRDLSGNPFMAAGTYKKLYVYDNDNEQNDVTPYRSTGTLGTDPFTTTNGSAIVTVAHTAHGLSVGDIITFSGSSAVGGITPNGTFSVTTVTNANVYTFTFTSNATSGATGGGASVAFSYEVPIGSELGAYGLGWGVGLWGIGTWGTAHSSSTIYIEPRVWSLDNFGKILLASFNGGSIYSMDPEASQPWSRAAKVDASAPTDVRAMFVTPERFVFALRANMVVSWCTQGDYTVWTPSSSNTANTRTLQVGTKLVAGRVLTDFVSLVWSDAALYRFQYTGTSVIYRSDLVGKDCGLISPNAAVVVAGTAYWMGQDNFWIYSGGQVLPMPNVDDIRAYVFNSDTLKTDATYQASATFFPLHNEIWFSYTIVGQTNPTRTVCYSITDQCWWPQPFGRTAGTHFTQGDTRPYLGNSDGKIFLHEDGLNAESASLPWSIELAPYAMTEGLVNFDVDHLVMDFLRQSGDISVLVEAWDYPRDSAPMDSDTVTYVAGDGNPVEPRVCGRYIGLTASCDAVDSDMRIGVPVAMIKKAGSR